MRHQAMRKIVAKTEESVAPADASGAAPPAVSPSEAATNRREHARHQLEVEIDVVSENNFYAGITLDLSEGGVFVATHLEKTVGTLVDLALRLPGSEAPLHCVGEVRWVRSYSEASDTSPGFGVRFVELGSAARNAIQSFLAQRDPLFYDE